MVNRYSAFDCPICGKSLDNCDVVVCPDCGAPYHKECYVSEGQCIFGELHKSGESWQPPKTVADIADGNAQLRCSRCGTVNPPHGLFCQVCGNQLGSSSESSSFNTTMPYGTNQTGGGAQGQRPDPRSGQMPFEMPLNPYTTPFGGVAPDEDIDGIPAKELAIFVGRNSHYYLPRFKEQAKAKSRVINWASFFFTGGHFIYRKMYLAGIIVIVLNILLSIPGAISLYQTLSSATGMAFSTAPVQNEGIFGMLFIFDFLGIMLRFACGILGNTLYKSHVYKSIRKIRENTSTEEEYLSQLSKKGSVAIKLITGLLVGYSTLYMLSMVFIMLTGV